MSETGVPGRVPELTESDLVDERVDARYDTLERGDLVGVGGNATVYEARPPDGPALALKEPHLDSPVPETVRARFEEEIAAWRRFDDHPSIVTLHAAGTDPHPWLALELVTGGSLEAYDPGPTEALWLGACLADGLAHAHANGVAHLDITPGNVLLRATDGDTWPVPALTDWGVGTLLAEGAANIEGLSPQYGAPEQFAPDQFGAPDERTDVYQLGTVLYEAFTGEPPFTGPPATVKRAVLEEPPTPPTGLNPGVPTAVDDVLDRALAKDPADRYESAAAFGAALAEVFTDVTGHEVDRPTDAGSEGRAGDAPGEAAGWDSNPRAASAYDRAITLDEQGFVQLTEGYFARRDPASLVEAWRRGLDLVDVHANHAVARDPPSSPDHDDGPFADSEAPTIARTLVETLRDGTDCAVLGPPGSGKSTVCKRVACEWFDRDYGPVFYRESGSTAFEDPAAILREIARTESEGQALVVVEDAVRPDAEAVFELLERVRDDTDVTVLVDAREEEWRTAGGDTTTVGSDPVTAGKQALRTVFVPRPDRETNERFIDRATTAVADAPDIDADRLAEDVRRARATGEVDEVPGKLFYLIHRLTALLRDPLAEDATSLTERVRAVREELAALGEPALDVGMAVNLLNAAGLGVHPELVYAVAPDDPVAVDDAIDCLDGEVVFPRETDWTGGTGPYATVHEAWSAEYLAGCLAAAGEEAARERFGRVLTRLLALADEPSRRERITECLHGDAPYLARVTDDPDGWLHDTVDRLFRLGTEQPRLAPLFGTTETAQYELPDRCDRATREMILDYRGDAHGERGAYRRARNEYERRLALVRESEDRAKEARSLNNLGTIARGQGQYDTAREYYEEALALSRETGAREEQALALSNLGTVAWRRSQYGTAQEYYEEALALSRETGDRNREAASLGNLGNVFAHRGDHDSASECFEESLTIHQRRGDRQEQARMLHNLGSLAVLQGELDAAEDRLRRSLALSREIGDPRIEAEDLSNLGDVARNRGEYETAAEYFEESLAIRRDLGDRRGEAVCIEQLGGVARERGEHDTARERYEESLEVYREIGDRRREATTLVSLGRVARTQGEYQVARDRLETGIDMFADLGAVRDELDAIEARARVAVETDDREAAVEWCERGLTGIEETDVDGLDERRETFEELHPER